MEQGVISRELNEALNRARSYPKGVYELSRLSTLYALRVTLLNQSNPGYLEKWQKLRDLLIVCGGVEVVPQEKADLHLENLVENGISSWGQGPPTNSLKYSELTPQVLLDYENYGGKLMYGYALGDNGLWRARVWMTLDGLTPDDPEGNLRYWGIPLDEEQLKALKPELSYVL
jgi:hypothetical protein